MVVRGKDEAIQRAYYERTAPEYDAWHVDREPEHNIALRYICTLLTRLSARSVLDVGCGTGANLEMLSQFGQVEGVDVSAEALSFCRARGLENVKQGEAEALPYEDNSFDLVTGLDVVEHLDDDLAGLKEMRRILRRGGHALLFVPAFIFLWGVQDEISNHRRRYTLPGLKRIMHQAGFEVERATYVNISFFAPILFGRFLMRTLRLRPESENNITIGFLNGILGKVLGAESLALRYLNFPFGVSILCVARKDSLADKSAIQTSEWERNEDLRRRRDSGK